MARPYDSVDLTVMQEAFLRYYCAGCSGKIYRRYCEGRMYVDESNGSEVIICRVYDVCRMCEVPIPGSDSSNMPVGSLTGIDSLFDCFNWGFLSRAEFDEEIRALVEQRGFKLA